MMQQTQTATKVFRLDERCRAVTEVELTAKNGIGFVRCQKQRHRHGGWHRNRRVMWKGRFQIT
jgi:hypothetical protein